MNSETATATPPTSEPTPPAERSASRMRTALTMVAAVAAIVALAAALWFGVGWVRAAFFTDGPRAAARDAALDGARQAAINITTMKLDDVDGSLATARSSMTGDLLDTANKNKDQMKQRAVAGGVNSEAKVLSAAVTELNSERDHAATLVVLEVDSSGPGKPSDRLRFTWAIDMVKSGDTWKAEQVQTVAEPVPLDSMAPAAPGTPAPSPTPGPAPKPGS
ncbi:hypothetical protein NDR87_24345 [Nocardia sp. CDC159]|uniref:Mce-associated membrane protein n=1 Tax=Nocardia pulmonis TaxID=2951408 RepID=A0A9X2E650_9NOCA|nr:MULTISPECIES: hypothetical protein [Nocardia]MCM6775032.1 hypothetical protein [Nocardia pulmonis]MCM6789502.1 hypothetical protein [Nocardia sp. CDC159]